MMPEMSGKELCYKIKNSIELSYIPVILLTAQVSEQYTIEGYMFGADDYITKPFNVKILIARCSNLIKTRQQMLERLKQPIANKQEAPDTININDRQLLEKATQIIKENFENPEFDMNLLASELGMGRSKLYTKLKEITGLTPNEFISQVKTGRSHAFIKQCTSSQCDGNFLPARILFGQILQQMFQNILWYCSFECT